MKPIKRNHLLIPSKFEDFFEKKALNRYLYKNRKRLINQGFTIFANSCVGGQIYRDLNHVFNSPFIGLYISPEDFITFLKDPVYWINQPLTEEKTKIKYPVGLLGGKIRIFFRAYTNFSEAKEKWDRRKNRINWNNIFVFLNPIEQDFGLNCNFKTHICNRNTVEEFLSLPYDNKIVLTNKKNLIINSYCVYMRRYSFLEYPPYIGIISCVSGKRIFDRYFDVVYWLNTGNIKRRKWLERF